MSQYKAYYTTRHTAYYILISILHTVHFCDTKHIQFGEKDWRSMQLFCFVFSLQACCSVQYIVCCAVCSTPFSVQYAIQCSIHHRVCSTMSKIPRYSMGVIFQLSPPKILQSVQFIVLHTIQFIIHYTLYCTLYINHYNTHCTFL